MLESQRVDCAIEEAVRARRAEIEEILRGGWRCGAPRFYTGGSFAKRTAIGAQFDVDVVVYFPAEARETPRELYEAVEQRLREAGHVPARHNVSLRLRYTPGWHVDVVPGRAVDAEFEYARLWAAERDATRQTSLKRHIAFARGLDRDTLRLLKLWRYRNAVAVGSFMLELAAECALRGFTGTVEDRFGRVLRFLAKELEGARLVDPANSANVVSEEVEWWRKREIAAAAASALTGPWERVVW
jgi:tRNA nucleotidyltransferase (CCA-adding enzyme)